MRSFVIRLSLFAAVVLVSLPLFLAAVEEWPIVDFGFYEERINKEYQSFMTNTSRYLKDGRPNFLLDSSIMMLSNWQVVIQSSGLRVPHILNSSVKKVMSQEHKQTVLGARIQFPQTRQNDRALIQPQFEFHAFNKKGNFTNLSNGIVANVGLIKEISVWVKGRNYPFDFAMRLQSEKNVMEEYFFGNLLFDNWRLLTWKNPNYVDAVKDRVLVRKPLYPKEIPYFRFKSFVLYRQMDQIGGDFVLYIKNASIVYEKFAETLKDSDINDEDEWKIMQKRANDMMEREQNRLADKADIYRTEQNRLKKP